MTWDSFVKTLQSSSYAHITAEPLSEFSANMSDSLQSDGQGYVSNSRDHPVLLSANDTQWV